MRVALIAIVALMLLVPAGAFAAGPHRVVLAGTGLGLKCTLATTPTCDTANPDLKLAEILFDGVPFWCNGPVKTTDVDPDSIAALQVPQAYGRAACVTLAFDTVPVPNAPAQKRPRITITFSQVDRWIGTTPGICTGQATPFEMVFEGTLGAYAFKVPTKAELTPPCNSSS